jgi:hypothetical protein
MHQETSEKGNGRGKEASHHLVAALYIPTRLVVGDGSANCKECRMMEGRGKGKGAGFRSYTGNGPRTKDEDNWGSKGGSFARRPTGRLSVKQVSAYSWVLFGR